MCIMSYTIHGNCGCARIHATLPCPRATDDELPKCDQMSYLSEEWVQGDCPDCKPAFDNKSGLKPRIKLNFTPKTPQPERVIMQEIQQDKGTFDEINRRHNQFRHMNQQQRENHKVEHFLNWLDDLEHPDPNNDDDFTQDATAAANPGEPCAPQPPNSPSSAPKPNNTPTSSSTTRSKARKQRKLMRARRAHWEHNQGRISPSPLPTPPVTVSQTISASVRGEYTLKAHQHILSADQRAAMRSRGYGHIHRLSFVSRQHHRNNNNNNTTTTTSDEHTHTLRTRHHVLSAAQREAMRSRGFNNVRRISVVSRRQHRRGDEDAQRPPPVPASWRGPGSRRPPFY